MLANWRLGDTLGKNCMVSHKQMGKSFRNLCAGPRPPVTHPEPLFPLKMTTKPLHTRFCGYYNNKMRHRVCTASLLGWVPLTDGEPLTLLKLTPLPWKNLSRMRPTQKFSGWKEAHPIAHLNKLESETGSITLGPAFPEI